MMTMNHNIRHSHHILRITKNKELIEIYASVALRMMAFSLVGVFVPIYFIRELGFTVNKVLLFYLYWAIMTIILTPIVAKLSARFGFKKMMFAAAPIAILYLLLLNLMKSYDIHYLWVAFLSAVSMQMFWIGFHIDFSRSSDKQKMGEEVGWWYTILMAVGLAGPILGGVLIKFVGFGMLFMFASLVMVLSAVPILFSKLKVTPGDFKIMTAFRKEYLRDFVVYMAYGIKEIADALIWPLFIFLLLDDVVKLGAIFSAVAFASAVSSPIIGKITDKHQRQGLLRSLGAIVDGISWPARILFKTFPSILSVSVVSFLAFLMIDIPLYKKFYECIKDHTECIVMRETALATGRIIAISVVMLLGFYAGFWVMGLSNLAYLLL